MARIRDKDGAQGILQNGGGKNVRARRQGEEQWNPSS